MIFVIIFAAILVIGIVLWILGERGVYHTAEGDELSSICGAVSTIVAGFALGICSILILCERTPTAIKQQEIRLVNTYEELEKSRASFETHTYTQVEATTHNNRVKEFVTSLETQQVYSQNPWFNWYVNPAYNNFLEEHTVADLKTTLYVE